MNSMAQQLVPKVNDHNELLRPQLISSSTVPKMIPAPS